MPINLLWWPLLFNSRCFIYINTEAVYIKCPLNWLPLNLVTHLVVNIWVGERSVKFFSSFLMPKSFLKCFLSVSVYLCLLIIIFNNCAHEFSSLIGIHRAWLIEWCLSAAVVRTVGSCSGPHLSKESINF